eukprot:m.167802 g.167802  ORF g.167802 m.167802 type:complete len:2710 (-) comp31477_c0_seq1:197-8326(-)
MWFDGDKMPSSPIDRTRYSYEQNFSFKARDNLDDTNSLQTSETDTARASETKFAVVVSPVHDSLSSDPVVSPLPDALKDRGPVKERSNHRCIIIVVIAIIVGVLIAGGITGAVIGTVTGEGDPVQSFNTSASSGDGGDSGTEPTSSPTPSPPTLSPRSSSPSAFPTVSPSISPSSQAPTTSPTTLCDSFELIPSKWPECSTDTATAGDTAIEGFPCSMPISLCNTAAPVSLPKSSENVLLMLKWVPKPDRRRAAPSSDGDGDDDAMIVARSYAGYEWEGVHPHPVHPTCEASSCVVASRLSTDGHYRVDAVARPRNVTQAAAIARFLLQASFGPTRAEIDAILTSEGKTSLEFTNDTESQGIEKWITAQLQLPPTLHRVHYRQRVNPRMEGGQYLNFIGPLIKPCDLNSRWITYAFTYRDYGKSLLVVPTTESDGTCYVSLYVDDVLRTQVTSFDGHDCNMASNVSYHICEVLQQLDGGWVSLIGPTDEPAYGNCFDRDSYSSKPHPAIHFFQPDARSTITYSASDVVTAEIEGVKDAFLIVDRLAGDCEAVSYRGNAFMGLRDVSGNITYARHDPREKMVTNTLDDVVDSNALDFGAESCPRVEKNAFNAHTCVRRYGNHSCAGGTYEAGVSTIALDEDTLKFWFERSGLYVYYVTGLRMNLVAPPCTEGLVSRWLRSPGTTCSNTAPTLAGAESEQIVVAAIRADQGGNADIVDIVASGFAQENVTACSSVVVGAHVQVDGDCWAHVHDDERSVFDFSRWVWVHPGSDIGMYRKRDPIRRWAEIGSAELQYPGHHSMERWGEQLGDVVFDPTRAQSQGATLGRLGDVVEFTSVPIQLQTPEMAARSGAQSTYDEVGVEVCGSRGEVANNPALGHRYVGDHHTRTEEQGIDRNYYWWSHSQMYTWTTVAMTAQDQLRQRMAWALSQIVVATQVEDPNGEPQTHFYDTFVEHAFGNYRDIMMEISQSKVMGDYLTFNNNRAYVVEGKYPDENFARELMQLFSIGVYQLNMDGTEKRDPATSELLYTYTNEDIMNAARVHTGWYEAEKRANYVSMSASAANNIDPMRLRVNYRDPFPKTRLNGGYLGDAYPLCAELPPQHFLQQGAKYVLTGNNSKQGFGDYWDKISDKTVHPHTQAREQFTPDKDASQLYAALCERDGVTNRCTFPSVVELPSTLTCHGVAECTADTLRVVKVVDGALALYYTYHEPPCVHHEFFNDGQAIQWNWHRQCADPKLATIAGVACCDKDGQLAGKGGDECTYLAEPVKLATAQQRCEVLYNATLCPVNFGWDRFCDRWCPDEEINVGNTTEWSTTCAATQMDWTTETCEVLAQIDSMGVVSINEPLSGRSATKLHNGNQFKVEWYPQQSNGVVNVTTSEDYPSVQGEGRANGCFEAGCEAVVHNGGVSCLCETTVDDKAVYTDATLAPPSSGDLRSKLFVGSAPPASFGTTVYTKCTTAACVATPGVAVWTKSGTASPATFDTDTVFELLDTPTGRRSITKWQRYLKNQESVVYLGHTHGKRVAHTPTNCTESTAYSASHACGQALDDYWWSNWVAAGEGVGAWIQVNYDRALTIDELLFSNRCNSERIERVRLEFSDGTNQTIVLPDDCEHNSHNISTVNTSFVRVVIEAVYRGTNHGAVKLEFQGPCVENNECLPGQSFSFRNPPNFNPFLGAQPVDWLRTPPYTSAWGGVKDRGDRETFSQNARYETEALIDDCFEHDNTAPFLAIRLIQRLTTSNPSPRYVKAVAEAFTTGTYQGKGSGDYGDLTATVTAILMDREARATVLDSDPNFGRLREPLLKILHLMRSMEYTSKEGVEVMLQQMDLKIGQGAHQQPSVFSYYLPDFSPDGAVAAAGLVSPESQLSTAPFVIGFLNGMNSLIDVGLSSCDYGFGDSIWGTKRLNCRQGSAGSDGQMEYRTPLDIGVRHEITNCQVSSEVGISPDYGCERAIDGNENTDWATAYEGAGAWYMATFANATTIDTFKYKNRHYWRERNHMVTLWFSDGSNQTVELLDDRDFNDYVLDEVTTSWVNISVESVYHNHANNGARELQFLFNDTQVTVEACEASTEYGITSAYECPMAFDGLSNTEWRNLQSIGEWINVTFKDDATVTVSKLEFEDVCTWRSKYKQLRLDFSDGSNQTVHLKNTEEDSCQIESYILEPVDTSYVMVTFEDTYRTSNQNAGVRELAFYADRAIPHHDVVEELATLLTPGRMSSATHDIIAQEYKEVLGTTNDAAFKHALKLITLSPEFHATNIHTPKPQNRPKPKGTPSENRPYKAVVAILLEGGADSWNMLVPHSKCSEPSDANDPASTRVPHDLYAEYVATRGVDAALAQSALLQVDIPSTNAVPQPCETFGLHPSLQYLQQAYAAKQATLFANMGAMAEPMTMHEYSARTKKQPLGNFGHGAMQRSMQSIDAVNKDAKGVLGRMVKSIAEGAEPMKSALYSTKGHFKMLEGAQTPSIVQPGEGVVRFKQYSTYEPQINALNNLESESVFAETYSSILEQSLLSTEGLGELLDNTSLTSGAQFPTNGGQNGIGPQLKEIAKLMAIDTRIKNTERAGFVSAQGGYDTHATFDLSPMLGDLDDALRAFEIELKALDLWDNVTIVIVSDFGRTLTSNSQGTDHGWGGNYMMLGGSVKGGQMLGKFPDHISEELSEVNIGRGRLVPTTPWESVWNGVAQWWDVEAQAMSTILPNMANWATDELFTKDELFKSD